MRSALWVVFATACGGSEPAAPVDAGVESSTDALPDTGASLRPCPTLGQGAVVGDVCWLLTPAESGLPSSGTRATVDQYALRPTTGARGKLVVFFNGSGGSPLAGTRGSATQSFYATARAAGLHVFAVSYRSDDAVGVLCKGSDACFLPTRRTIMTGVFESGAAPSLANVTPDEGALARLVAALKTLSVRDPMGGWDAFLDPNGTTDATRVRWSKVIASGHSHGGGHAALVGLSFPIDRVVALASPCDLTATGPATWLDATTTTYATDPKSAFHGLGAVGDTTCTGYPAIWTSLGLDPSRRHADAVICAGATAHSAPLECIENAATWSAMLQ